MDPKLSFFFYLAAAVCFALAAFGGDRVARGRSMAFLPVGLLLWLVPTLWGAGEAAF